LFVAACSEDEPTGPGTQPRVAELSGNITSNRTLYADTVYTLSGFVKVANGATLTIQAGTKIIGDPDVPGSALFILRGARIEANGTAQNPIVLTSAKTDGNRRAGDWGGLILVGNATASRTGVIVEGSNASVPNGNEGITYSEGVDDDDDSGTLRYVRVEFAGYAVAENTELNSFSFAAVGRGTTLEYLQAMTGLDDNFEWWGGTVDGRYLVSYESGDDHFDASEGYRGRNQFLIALQTFRPQPLPGTGGLSGDPQGFEIDGCDGTGCPQGFNSQPYNMPLFANFTMIGPGPGVLPASAGIGMMIRRGTGGVYINGIVGRWRQGMSVRDEQTDQRRQDDSLNVRNVLYAQNEVTLDPANFTQQANFVNAELDSVSAAGQTAASLFTNLAGPNVEPTLQFLDWSLAAASPARTGGMTPFTGRILTRAGAFVQATAYRGAADPNGTKWWEGWTIYERN
jgi:hypothetical protein